MAVSPPRSPALAAIEPLDDGACRALLARHRLCVLSVVDGDEPYAIPLYYGYDGDTLYLGLAEGRKTEVLDRNGRLCITVVEAGEGDRWASVQVTGDVEWMEGDRRDDAVRVLMEHNQRVRGGGPTPRAAPASPEGGESQPPRRHGGGRILRVANPRFSGRTRP